MVYAVALVVLTLPACGGSSGGAGSCLKVEPCGGNLVGTWNLTTGCVNTMALSSQFTALCPGISVSGAHVSASGPLTFNMDMTYSAMLNEGVSFTLNIPASCNTSGASCAALGAAIVDPSIKSATCSGTTSCACSIVLAPIVTNETGTYTTAGTAAMLMSSTGTTNGGDYCVQGTELHLVTVDRTMNMGPMGQATINEDLVAIKK
jgi:hypothetical protein